MQELEDLIHESNKNIFVKKITGELPFIIEEIDIYFNVILKANNEDREIERKILVISSEQVYGNNPFISNSALRLARKFKTEVKFEKLKIHWAVFDSNFNSDQKKQIDFCFDYKNNVKEAELTAFFAKKIIMISEKIN